MTETRIALSEPCLAGNTRRYLDECVETNFVSSVGPFVDRFEREFAASVGAKYAVACASGTAAIHVALRLLDLGPGDEVFVSSLTFIASVNPVLYQGGTPVLVDSEEESWNANPDLIVEELERRAREGKRQPKVVEVVHILGHPANMEPVSRACERFGVVLLEDAAEALGARYSAGAFAGKQVGTIGRLGCFSFNGNKIITTGGGGMLVTDDEKLAKRAKYLTTQARLPGLAYRHEEVGYNYRLPNLNAALGVAQLEQLHEFLGAKKRLASVYDERLRGREAIELAPRAGWADPSFWLYSIRLRGNGLSAARDEALARLAARAVEARPIWSALHTLPLFRDTPRLGEGRVAESLANECLSLPSSVTLGAQEQDRVIDALATMA